MIQPANTVFPVLTSTAVVSKRLPPGTRVQHIAQRIDWPWVVKIATDIAKLFQQALR